MSRLFESQKRKIFCTVGTPLHLEVLNIDSVYYLRHIFNNISQRIRYWIEQIRSCWFVLFFLITVLLRMYCCCRNTILLRKMFFVLSRAWQDEKHLSLFLYRAQNLPSLSFLSKILLVTLKSERVKTPTWEGLPTFEKQTFYWPRTPLH